MKEILISIQPKWVAKILNGKKTVEIRKTRPKCELPVRVYIYETKLGKGKVVAEFTLKEVNKFDIPYPAFFEEVVGFDELEKKSCVSKLAMHHYVKNDPLFAWHVDNLMIYDTPKALHVFGLEKAPQSWCYVKKVQDI